MKLTVHLNLLFDRRFAINVDINCCVMRLHMVSIFYAFGHRVAEGNKGKEESAWMFGGFMQKSSCVLMTSGTTRFSFIPCLVHYSPAPSLPKCVIAHSISLFYFYLVRQIVS